MVVQVTLPGIQNLGYKFWIIWAVICFTFIPITYFFYPETANRTLEGKPNAVERANQKWEIFEGRKADKFQDIDRFFETKPGIFIQRNKTAVQLQRPTEYIEADERIAREETSLRDKEKDGSIGYENVALKEEV